MVWNYWTCSSKHLGPSQKTLRPSWCPKLVTGLSCSLLFPTAIANGTEGNQGNLCCHKIQQVSNVNGDWSSNTVSEIQQKQLSDSTKRSNINHQTALSISSVWKDNAWKRATAISVGSAVNNEKAFSCDCSQVNKHELKGTAVNLHWIHCEL